MKNKNTFQLEVLYNSKQTVLLRAEMKIAIVCCEMLP